MSRPTVCAVIPIRTGDVCDADCKPKVLLRGAPLWVYTFEAALKAASLQRIIVAADDARFYQYVDEFPRLEHPIVRPPYLSAVEMTTLDVLGYVTARLSGEGYCPDYYMLLEITHPIRPRAIIDRLVDIAESRAFDSMFTAYVGAYNYWYETGSREFARVRVKAGRTRSPLYQEMIGLASLFRSELLQSDDPYGQKVGIVPIHGLEGLIDTREEEGLWLAEQYLQRFGHHAK